MTTAREPDYTRYTLEQLERARRSIDVERFPERTKILDILIADRKARAAEAAAQNTATTNTAPVATADEESLFGSYKKTFTFKTRGQVLLAIFGSIAMTGGGSAMMLMQGQLESSMQVFLGVWILVGTVQIGQLVLEYRRMKREAVTAHPHQRLIPPSPNANANANANATKAKLTNTNQSPIQRM